MADLALLPEVVEHTELVLQRHRRVDPVELEEVDALETEPTQAELGLLPQVRGTSERHPLAGAGPDESRLRRDHEPVGIRVERLADQLLVHVRPVRVGRVDEVDPELDGAAQDTDRLVVVARRAPDTRAGLLHRAEAEAVDPEVAADRERVARHRYTI